MQRNAQRQLYEYMAPRLYPVCRRYLSQQSEIEEAMADAFYTILTKLDQLRETAAFEAWARRIAVNFCLAVLRRRGQLQVSLDDLKQEPVQAGAWPTHLEEDDILRLLKYLPEGCRTVFNLFAIEGYSHKEIADQLGVSESTSKTQFLRAKAYLIKVLQKQKMID